MQRTSEFLQIGHYSPNTARNYLSELHYFFNYHADVSLNEFSQDHVIHYLLYLIKTLRCSRSKCHMTAQSIAFFFRHVLQKPFVIPTLIFPRKSNKLPPVMSQKEMGDLIDTIKNVKHRTVVMLLYCTGMRVREISNLKIEDIDSKQMRIKVVQGKGAKDRYTLLSEQVLQELRAYWLIYRPKEYLFNGIKVGTPLSSRAIQHLVKENLIKLGLKSKCYSVHSIRHSFATHMMNAGTDLYTIKELMGHSSLHTTALYLHLSDTRTKGLVNPYDALQRMEQANQHIKGKQ